MSEKDLKEIFRQLEFNRDELKEYVDWTHDKCLQVNLSTFGKYKSIKTKTPSQSIRSTMAISFRTRY